MTTATDFRKTAATLETRAAESFERCDTDGFLSQWGNDITARLNRVKADITDEGKTAIFTGLFEGDRRVKAKMITTKFGTAWLLDDEETALIEQRGKKFLPCNKNSRILKGLGLRMADERAPAWACLGGEGTGLAGCASVRVVVFRTGDKWGGDAVAV